MSKALSELARALSVPLKSVLLAAHAKVMGLLSGQSDVVTGYVTSGRPDQEDSARLLGLFLNTVPLRVRLQPGTWSDLVQRAFRQEQELLPHRRVPLPQVKRWTGSGRPLRRRLQLGALPRLPAPQALSRT
jgi:non-ribosomal peptide synthetase component F